MPPTKPPYPPEFRREAVQLAQISERCEAVALAATRRCCDVGVNDEH